MSRMVWAVLGTILAIWLAFMAIGWLFAMVRLFFVIGIIAAVVVLVVRLLARRPRRG